MAPLANNMGLFVATPSYNGRIAFSLISERAILHDIAVFRECIDASFADLLAAAPKAGKAKAAKAKPDRQSGVRGKGVSVRVALGGRRLINTKTYKLTYK